jgi:PmbA protein
MRTPLDNALEDRLVRAVERVCRAGAAGARIAVRHGEMADCTFESGRLKNTGAGESLACTVDVVADGRRGTVSGNRLDTLDTMVEQARALARMGSAVHFNAWPAPGATTPVATRAESALALDRDRMIEAGQTIVDALKAYDPDLYIMAGAGRSETEGLLVTSGGVRHAVRRTSWSLGGGVQRTEGTDILHAGYGRSWGEMNAFFDPAAVAGRVLTDLRRAEETVPPPAGAVTAYLPPEALSAFLRPVVMGVNGRNVAKGDSPLAGRLGERVLAETLTLVDDPHVDFAGGAASLDGDGVPTRRQAIFEKGVLRRFLYDLDSAGLAGAAPTGNGGCSPHWLCVAPGTEPSDALLASIEDGIYVKSLIGFGQGNIMNGDFSCNLGLGYRIRNGAVAGRVKNVMIAGNIFDLFRENVRVSADTDYDGRLPHAVVEGVHIATQNERRPQ